jgi:hypothetical protein
MSGGRGTNRVAEMCKAAGVAPPDFQEIAAKWYIHHDTSCLKRLPDDLWDECRPGDRDPFHHHLGDEH